LTLWIWTVSPTPRCLGVVEREACPGSRRRANGPGSPRKTQACGDSPALTSFTWGLIHIRGIRSRTLRNLCFVVQRHFRPTGWSLCPRHPRPLDMGSIAWIRSTRGAPGDISASSRLWVKSSFETAATQNAIALNCEFSSSTLPPPRGISHPRRPCKSRARLCDGMREERRAQCSCAAGRRHATPSGLHGSRVGTRPTAPGACRCPAEEAELPG
jgi:hypothetical protein